MNFDVVTVLAVAAVVALCVRLISPAGVSECSTQSRLHGALASAHTTKLR